MHIVYDCLFLFLNLSRVWFLTYMLSNSRRHLVKFSESFSYIMKGVLWLKTLTFSWKLTINFLNKFSVWLFNTVQILCNACGTIDIPFLIYIGLPIFARLSSTLKADLLSCHSWRYGEQRKTGAMVPVLATLAFYNSAIIYICVIFGTYTIFPGWFQFYFGVTMQ